MIAGPVSALAKGLAHGLIARAHKHYSALGWKAIVPDPHSAEAQRQNGCGLQKLVGVLCAELLLPWSSLRDTLGYLLRSTASRSEIPRYKLRPG